MSRAFHFTSSSPLAQTLLFSSTRRCWPFHNPIHHSTVAEEEDTMELNKVSSPPSTDHGTVTISPSGDAVIIAKTGDSTKHFIISSQAIALV
jgi:hypothetical protein